MITLEQRAGVWVVVDGMGGTMPASVYEIELWQRLQQAPAGSDRARYTVNLYLTRKLVQALERCTKHTDADYEALEAGRKWLAELANTR